MTRHVAAVLAVVLLVAACSSGGSRAKPPSPSPATSATGATGDRNAYVDAIYDGLVAETPTVPKDEMRCVARAIVDGVTVARFHDADVTVAEVRSPQFEPPAQIANAMSTAERVGLATHLQTCGIGRIVGVSVAGSFGDLVGSERARVGQCFSHGFVGPSARRMIAGMMLGDLSIPDATQLARITIECVGLAPLIENASGLKLSPAEQQCVDRVGQTDASFLQLLSDQFRSVQSAGQSARTRLGVQVFVCLTPAHRAAAAKRS